MPKKQLHVIYSGTVQGVGFRYTVERLSRHFAVTGYVKNLCDGTVELVAEGDLALLKDFLSAIASSELKPYIRDTRVSWNRATDRFKTFGVAF